VNLMLTDLKPLNDVATDEESLRYLFALLEFVRPRVIVEAGTYRGHFACGAARIVPGAHIHTFDPIDHGWPRTDPNITYHQRDFDFVPEPFDFAFVDSGPPFVEGTEWEHTMRWRHWKFACESILPGGIVVCHDTGTTDWQHATDIIAMSGLHLQAGRGLTIYQRKQ
jgi:hypothetical protein